MTSGPVVSYCYPTMAQAQDLSDVLNPKYIPLTTVEHDLFWEKQKFMYAVLETKVKTVKGKSIIRQYKSKYDAQKAYEKLEQHHCKSNTAIFAANNIMVYLTTVHIDDGLWHGSLENIIINWQEQFRRYEQLVPITSRYKDEQKHASSYSTSSS
jgi:hypothetical protein